MIAVLGNQDVGEQGRAGETLGDRTFRSRRLVDGPAGPATVTRAANPDNPEPRLDDEPKPLDLGLRFAEAGALGGERAHHVL